jgi:hypothetical protein
MSLKLAALLLFAFSGPCLCHEVRPQFLFLGSYHMNNHNRDMFNVRSSDVTSPRHQAEILRVVAAIEQFKPTKIMVERDAADQSELEAQLGETCAGTRAETREEYEQIGFRLACHLHVPVIAVNYNDLGPIQDPKKIDLSAADAEAWSKVQALGESDNKRLQEMEATKSVGDVLKYLNSEEKTREVASRYYVLARLESSTERVGANWVQYWYGRNLVIFNNIARHTSSGDRVLVIYGFGHGYILRRMAEESGEFEVVDTEAFLEKRL